MGDEKPKVLIVGGGIEKRRMREVILEKLPVVVIDDIPPDITTPIEEGLVFEISKIEMPPEIKEAARKKKHWETGKFYDKFYQRRNKRGK